MSQIVLRDEKSHDHAFTDNKADLEKEHTFVEYKIKSGKWILYKQQDYNPTVDTADSVTVNFEGPMKDFQTLPFSPLSLRKFEEIANSCILFERKNFCGDAQPYTKASPDVAFGSSLIIFQEKQWQLYEKKNYDGGSKTLNPKHYPNLQEQGFDDPPKSIKPV